MADYSINISLTIPKWGTIRKRLMNECTNYVGNIDVQRKFLKERYGIEITIDQYQNVILIFDNYPQQTFFLLKFGDIIS